MKPIQTTIPAGRLSNEVTLAEAIGQWLHSTNSFCSSLMGERVTHLQVMSALGTFAFLTVAVFAIPKDIFITILFLALAAFCRRGMGEQD